MSAKLVATHSHVEGFLQNVKAHGAVQGILDLMKDVKFYLIIHFVLIRDQTGPTHHLIEVQIYNRKSLAN